MSFWIQYPDLTFDAKEHKYAWQERPVPSVTGIFDRIGFRKDDKSAWVPLGCPDFAKREHDSTFGNAFHKMANGIVSGRLMSVPDDMVPWRDKIQRFLGKYSLESLYDTNGNMISEYPMYSSFHRFAGTLDWLCREISINKLWLVEWKSTQYYQKNYAWQTAGYSMVVREVFGGQLFDKREKIIRVTVLFSADKEEPDVIIRDNNPEDLIAFQSILNTYKLAAL